MLYAEMFCIGLLCWLVATLTAGGAGLIFLMIAGLVLPLPVATMTLGFAGTIAGFYRAWIYRKDIDLDILKWLIPGTLIGSVLGAYLFGEAIDSANAESLKVFLGLLLVVSGIFGLFKINLVNIPAQKYYFFPMGIFTSFISGLIGASSPIMNVLFRKFSLKPTQIVGTKSLNLFLLQFSKTIIYIVTVIVTHKAIVDNKTLSTTEFFMLGSVTALGCIVGVYGGKRLLDKVNEGLFDQVLKVMMVLYGMYMLADLFLFT